MLAITRPRAHLILRGLSWARCVHSRVDSSYDRKYAAKLHQKAKECDAISSNVTRKGIGLDELKEQARQEAHRKQVGAAAPSSLKHRILPDGEPSQSPGTSSTRKDSAPVKPLSSFFNIPKLLATPHTPSQIFSLWIAYHASRSAGTGRGFVWASLPVESYNTMIAIAKKYPVFVLPVPRQPEPAAAAASEGTAHEFYFLQWDFHPPPPQPSAADPDPFKPPSSDNALPQISTVLFTPLQEYKLRNSFATPYLVLTFYTDLSSSHGLVLLRGEITPSAATAAPDTTERYLLSQVDAQMLAMGVQKFYLWGEKKGPDARDSAPEELLRQFHETPHEFNWQELLKHSALTA